LKIGSLESEKIIIGSLESEKSGPYSSNRVPNIFFEKNWLKGILVCNHTVQQDTTPAWGTAPRCPREQPPGCGATAKTGELHESEENIVKLKITKAIAKHLKLFFMLVPASGSLQCWFRKVVCRCSECCSPWITVFVSCMSRAEGKASHTPDRGTLAKQGASKSDWGYLLGHIDTSELNSPRTDFTYFSFQH